MSAPVECRGSFPLEDQQSTFDREQLPLPESLLFPLFNRRIMSAEFYIGRAKLRIFLATFAVS
jgi:hypothetical protein